MLLDRRLELFEIEAVIGHRAKDRFAVVAALDEVLRLAGQHKPHRLGPGLVFKHVEVGLLLWQGLYESSWRVSCITEIKDSVLKFFLPLSRLPPVQHRSTVSRTAKRTQR